jgi:glycolate oxidase iron-sulfur subunit
METHLADFIRDTPDGIEADAILRACVHCGFCTATCPTYQLLGDELDGPRGRIYLIKEMLEGATPTAKSRLHLDRCLTCRACETTCPSGVKYGRLADIGRDVVEKRATPRPLRQRLLRRALRYGLTRRWLFDPLMALGQALRPALPASLQAKVPRRREAGPWPGTIHDERMLLLDGCVQPAMMPRINAATARVLDKAGISLVIARDAGCCGAIQQHLADREGALSRMRQNIDAWIPYLNQGITTIVVNASGCAAMIAEYGHLLRDDPEYAEKAARVSAAMRDVSQVVAGVHERLLPQLVRAPFPRAAFHPPCTLQHALQIRGTVEALFKAAGIDLFVPRDAHLCCGSAGTYSIFEPAIATRLRNDKLAKLAELGAPVIVSANIGCIAHLQGGTAAPVLHWIEVLDDALMARHVVNDGLTRSP